jgi:gamma-glutamylcyclotransferase (GGCT)/AIG2-like uncharacterized protein YtfP
MQTASQETGVPDTEQQGGDMVDLVFFYGTLMTGFDRRGRTGVENQLTFYGRGSIRAALFDLGIYPAAVPTADGSVRGEVYRMSAPADVLAALDQVEGYSEDDPDHSLYVRQAVPAALDDGRTVTAWVYFYNAPLGGAQRISSGDYLEHVRVR